MTKEEDLKSFSEDQLKEIAQKEGINVIPKTFKKKDLIKYLEGVLTLKQIKSYEEEYFEKEIERDIHIHEKIKERGIKKKIEENSEITIDRKEIIYELMKNDNNISKTIVEAITDDLHEEIPSGSKIKYYENMSDHLLKTLDEIFIKRKEDRTGRYFEYLTANWLWKKYSKKGASDIKLRQKIPSVGEIDIVLYKNIFEDKEVPFVIAECKDKKTVKIEDIDRWLGNSSRIIQRYGEEMIEYSGKKIIAFSNAVLYSYFFSSSGFTQGIIDRLTNNPNIKNGVYTAKKQHTQKFQVELYLIDVRDKQFKGIYPYP